MKKITNGSDYTKHNEGLRLKMYTCSSGYNTAGWGRNMDEVGLRNIGEAELFFKNDMAYFRKSLILGLTE